MIPGIVGRASVGFHRCAQLSPVLSTGGVDVVLRFSTTVHTPVGNPVDNFVSVEDTTLGTPAHSR